MPKIATSSWVERPLGQVTTWIKAHDCPRPKTAVTSDDIEVAHALSAFLKAPLQLEKENSLAAKLARCDKALHTVLKDIIGEIKQYTPRLELKRQLDHKIKSYAKQEKGPSLFGRARSTYTDKREVATNIKAYLEEKISLEELNTCITLHPQYRVGRNHTLDNLMTKVKRQIRFQVLARTNSFEFAKKNDNSLIDKIRDFCLGKIEKAPMIGAYELIGAENFSRSAKTLYQQACEIDEAITLDEVKASDALVVA